MSHKDGVFRPIKEVTEADSTELEPTELDPTEEERRAIASLKRLAKRWPSSLWLFAAGGSLVVMRKGEGGRVHRRDQSIDPAYILDDILIPCDGGDW